VYTSINPALGGSGRLPAFAISFHASNTAVAIRLLCSATSADASSAPSPSDLLRAAAACRDPVGMSGGILYRAAKATVIPAIFYTLSSIDGAADAAGFLHAHPASAHFLIDPLARLAQLEFPSIPGLVHPREVRRAMKLNYGPEFRTSASSTTISPRWLAIPIPPS
jgi:hypothetical protein